MHKRATARDESTQMHICGVACEVCSPQEGRDSTISHQRNYTSAECSGAQRAWSHMVPASLVSPGSSGTRQSHISTRPLVLPSRTQSLETEVQERQMWAFATPKQAWAVNSRWMVKLEYPKGEKNLKKANRSTSATFQGTMVMTFC